MKNSYDRFLIAFDNSKSINLGYDLAKLWNSELAVIIHNESSNNETLFVNNTEVKLIGSGYNLQFKNSRLPKGEKIDLDNNEKNNCIKIIERYKFQYDRLLFKSKHYDELISDLIDYSYTIIKENLVELVILPEIPHQKLDYFIYLVSKKLKISQLFISTLPAVNYHRSTMFLSDEYNSFGSKFKELLAITINEKLKLDDIRESHIIDYYYAFKRIENILYPRIATVNTPSNMVRLKEAFSRFINYSYYSGIRQTLIKIIFSLIRLLSISYHKFNSIWIMRFYIKKSVKNISDYEKYVYYPLHFQPEATTVPAGNYYSDQIKVINYLNDNLPDNIIIIVKEHPAYLLDKTIPISLSRSLDFYKSILNKPKFRLVDINTDSYSLIKNSIAVATVTGTVSFEALPFNIPSLNFGESRYNALPNALPILKINKSNFYEIVKQTKKLSKDTFINILYVLSKTTFPINAINLGYNNINAYTESMHKVLLDKLTHREID
jgi:hypothetical protein